MHGERKQKESRGRLSKLEERILIAWGEKQVIA